MGRIRIGLSSWTDKSLIDSGKFYPRGVDDAEGRLRFYVSEFPDLVEVNSTYYGLPSERNSLAWVQRTPDDFLFDVKMFSLLTNHPTQPRALPKDMLALLPENVRTKAQIYLRDAPPELAGEVMERFVRALQPLQQAGKLGAILGQFPNWFHPNQTSIDHIAWCRDHLGGYRMAVEFRNGMWMAGATRDQTLAFLKEHGIAYVCVDEPQGYVSSVPPLAAVTSAELAYVRFHGRRGEMWEKTGATVQERTMYVYSESELKEWVPKIERLADGAREVHVLLNTNYEDHAVINARQLKLFLEEGS